MAARRPPPTATPTLDEIRERVAGLKAEIDTTDAAPVPAADVERRLRPAVESAIAAARARSISAFADPDARHAPQLGESLGFLALLLGVDDVVERLAKRVLELQGREPGLPIAARRARLTELRDELLRAEIDEERLVLAELDAGRPCERRPDVSGEALLCAWRDDPIDSPEAA